MKIYIAGPMSGIPYYNAPAFYDAQWRWQAAHENDEVEIPFDANSIVWRRHFGHAFDPYHDTCDWGDPILPEMIAEDNKALLMSDAVALLPGWEKSKGSRGEILLAYNTGKKFYDAITFEPMVLDAAVVIINKTGAPPCGS